MTPDRAGSTTSGPYHPANPAFLLEPDGGNGGLADVSALMFPSNDPFAYPSQPMSTLEHGSFVKPEDAFHPVHHPPVYGTTAAAPSHNGPYDHLEVPLMGPFPPYRMPAPPNDMDMPHPGDPMGLGGVGAGAAMEGGADGAGWTTLHCGGDPPGMNLDEIFGDPWAGGWTMDPRYGP